MQFENEAEFNGAVREVLTARGLRCVHVREAHTPGPLDLVVWRGRVLVAWIELKVDDEPVRASQKEFIRQNTDCSMVLKWSNREEMVLAWLIGLPAHLEPYRMTWDDFVNNWVVNLASWAVSRQRKIEEYS